MNDVDDNDIIPVVFDESNTDKASINDDYNEVETGASEDSDMPPLEGDGEDAGWVVHCYKCLN